MFYVYKPFRREHEISTMKSELEDLNLTIDRWSKEKVVVLC